MREECDHRDAEFDALTGNLEQFVNGQAVDARHARYGFTASLAFHHEDRKDQVVRGHYVLTHQATGEIVMAHAAHAHHRIGTKSLHFKCPWEGRKSVGPRIGSRKMIIALQLPELAALP